MAWARFDDGYTDHPKVAEAGPMAELLDMRAIIWCARYETDGYISPAGFRHICRDLRNPKLLAKRLVELERWDTEGAGFVVRDFLEFNPSHEQRTTMRAKWRDQKQRQAEARRSAEDSAQDSAVESAEIPPKGRGNPQRDECQRCDSNGFALDERGELIMPIRECRHLALVEEA